MCGGVGFKVKNISERELERFYNDSEMSKFKRAGRAESYFWAPKAVLPVLCGDGVQLKLWGNKDKDLGFPVTAWAKSESLSAGKWNYLEPREVLLMIDSGYEKKHWFDLPEGARGIVVRRSGEERVYLVTEEADEDYIKHTGHHRQPVGHKKYRK